MAAVEELSIIRARTDDELVKRYREFQDGLPKSAVIIDRRVQDQLKRLVLSVFWYKSDPHVIDRVQKRKRLK